MPPRPSPDEDPDKTVLATTRPGAAGNPPSAGSAASAPTSANTNTLPPGTRVAEFEVIGVIGEGGFGIVYRAIDHVLKRTVALKEYMPSALASRQHDLSVSVKSNQHIETFLVGLKSFINEAQLLAQFDHPALVKVFRFWEANKTAYMVMPLYEGGTLKQALKARLEKSSAPPDEAWLRKLLVPLLDALATLHAADCLHRDIAPDNILLVGGDKAGNSGDPRPVLLDFGAARRVIGESTQALTVILKPGYAPIEQYDEIPGMKQGAWTDLYALAAVMHFAITGKAPPPSVRRLMHDPYVPLASQKPLLVRYTEVFLRTIDRTLSARVEGRPKTAAEFRRLLQGESIATAAESASAAQAIVMPHASSQPAATQPESPSLAAGDGGTPHTTPARERSVLLPQRKSSWRSLIALGAGTFVVLVIAGVVVSQGLGNGGDAAPSTVPGKAEPAAVTQAAAAPVVPSIAPPSPEPAPPASAAPPAPTKAASVALPPAAPAAKAPPALEAPVPAAEPAATDPRAARRKALEEKQAERLAIRERLADARAQRQAVAGVESGKAAAPATAWITTALGEARDCLAQRRYACTIDRAQQILNAEPDHALALDLRQRARAGQEAALASDWKMR